MISPVIKSQWGYPAARIPCCCSMPLHYTKNMPKQITVPCRHRGSRLWKLCNRRNAAICGWAGGAAHNYQDTNFRYCFQYSQRENPCALCAKMPKGALYEAAKSLVATRQLLHTTATTWTDAAHEPHMYEGRINTFSPKSYLSRRDITLIRPFVFCGKPIFFPPSAALISQSPKSMSD